MTSLSVTKAVTDQSDLSDLQGWNERFEGLSAQARVYEALEHLPGAHVLSSSFGAQSAVSLHLLNEALPGLPVIFLDTGYLFPETYQFVEDLTSRLHLNVQVYSNPMSPARQEAIYGQRWQQGLSGIEQYNHDNKVEPMQRALEELAVGTWFTGVRRSQAPSRASTPFVQLKNGTVKVSPIADWTDRDVHAYLKAHDLPYHPLWAQGYVSIGDVHTTKSLAEVTDAAQTRFFGLKRECGLHE